MAAHDASAGDKNGGRVVVDETLQPIFARFLRRVPQQARSRALIEALVESLDDILKRGEGDGVTLAPVLRRAGVGFGSFYEYFTDKDALLGFFIGAVTRNNFQALTRELDDCNASSLEGLIHAAAQSVARRYLEHPVRMRVIVDGIGRLGLMRIVITERDRFAHELAVRAARFLPQTPAGEIDHAFRTLSDAAMGIVITELFREGIHDVGRVGNEVAELSVALLATRFPDRLAHR